LFKLRKTTMTSGRISGRSMSKSYWAQMPLPTAQAGGGGGGGGCGGKITGPS
jgi:hypothetical protein